MRDREARTGDLPTGEGRARRERGAVVVAPRAPAAGAAGTALARGAVAASFAVSGPAFEVPAEEVTANGPSPSPSAAGGGGATGVRAGRDASTPSR
ncbi:hypothetical protein [Streptomyces prasinopilosus]|uniref:Uncharacterized protein n=1 Tax=Streptomyces prasinopilosus TaxID=67344 RepID=A0A1G6ZFW4_9ACTN|nr:hypothetical protein [Streptomyces prasinopilosus]SDE01539.1 hypothetical protein SAMN05216505_1158 [Streptomyces prasinopilosus]